MTEALNVTTERVEDIPILLAHSHKMGRAELLDEYFKPHGNRKGISLDWTRAIWVAYILSEGDHRMNHGEPRVDDRLQTLSSTTGQAAQKQHWSDDRLAPVLDAPSHGRTWQHVEIALTRHPIRVYQLQRQRVRLDSTTASGYWTANEQGLFQCGYSKDHRPDWPQLNVMLLALDPLGLPLATHVVAGKGADDPLSLPAARQMSQSLQMHSLLYIGDGKMAALSTRAAMQVQGKPYRCPLANKQLPDEVLETFLQPIWAEEHILTPVYRSKPGEEPELIAGGDEQTTIQRSNVEGQTLSWSERQVIVRSLKLAEASQAVLQAALLQVHAYTQGNPHSHSADALRAAARAFVICHHVGGLLRLRINEQVTEGTVRAYGNRPATLRRERSLSLHTEINEAAGEVASCHPGWRAYATNHPQKMLEQLQARLVYREADLVERCFGRFTGKPLSLSPMDVQSDQRATGLVRLLLLGLRALTLLKFCTRQHLARSQESLPGLYADNPKRIASRPTAEVLLHAFQHIHRSMVAPGPQFYRSITPRSELQKRVVALWDLSSALHDQLSDAFLEPT